MNSKNEEYFYRRLNIQMCEAAEAEQKEVLKDALKTECSWNSRTQ